jgi:hypothetical protein
MRVDQAHKFFMTLFAEYIENQRLWPSLKFNSQGEALDITQKLAMFTCDLPSCRR